MKIFYKEKRRCIDFFTMELFHNNSGKHGGGRTSELLCNKSMQYSPPYNHRTVGLWCNSMHECSCYVYILCDTIIFVSVFGGGGGTQILVLYTCATRKHEKRVVF